MVKYKDNFSNTINYSSQATLDQRIGMCFKPDTSSTFTFGMYTGLMEIKSKSVDPISEFELTALSFDLYLKYTFDNPYLHALAVGPSICITLNQSQTNNAQLLTKDGFVSSFVGFYGELELGDFQNTNYAVNPYLYYRHILTNLEGTDFNTESTHLSNIGFGLKISL